MSTTTSERVDRSSSVQWVRVGDISVSPLAQRELRIHMVERIARDLDPDKLGIPVVNRRAGRVWVIDGQHRIEALKMIGWEDQKIECQVYEGLDEQTEAERFLGLNNRLSVGALDRFLVSLTAQSQRELRIAHAVESQGLTIGSGKGRIGAVGALGKVYDTAGEATLAEALRMILAAYGESGMRAEVIEGMGLVAHRYNGELTEKSVERLAAARGGVSGLISRAEIIRRQVGRTKSHCVAAAIVETINVGRGGKKLRDWWS